MSDRRAFIEAILANPADDLPRLVYADWLEEHGDNLGRARADLVRIQCELARCPADDPRRPDLLRREGALLENHTCDWLSQLPHSLVAGILQSLATSGRSFGPADIGRERFQRGFVTRLHFSVRSYLDSIDELIALEPATSLSLGLYIPDEVGDTVNEDFLLQLARDPRLMFVSRLGSIQPPGFGARRWPILLSSPHLSSLTRINLDNENFGLPGVSALVNSPSQFRLREFEISYSMGGVPDGELGEIVQAVELLANSPKFAMLETLLLHDDGLGEQVVDALVRSPYLSRSLLLRFGGGDPLPMNLWHRLNRRFRLLSPGPYH
ncbi:MAG: TIGR02996 domain-containing protein [Gemmataceae bacterium]|nr:TIGR02996 domain-containing protein [Gemmataceae bacterium]